MDAASENPPTAPSGEEQTDPTTVDPQAEADGPALESWYEDFKRERPSNATLDMVRQAQYLMSRVKTENIEPHAGTIGQVEGLLHAIAASLASLSTERARMEVEAKDRVVDVLRLRAEVSRLTSELDRVRGALTEIRHELTVEGEPAYRINYDLSDVRRFVAFIDEALGTPDATTREAKQ